MGKVVLLSIVRRTNWLSSSNQINCEAYGCDVKNLHDGVVIAVEGRKQVCVSRKRNQDEEFLGPKADALCILGNVEASKKDED